MPSLWCISAIAFQKQTPFLPLGALNAKKGRTAFGLGTRPSGRRISSPTFQLIFDCVFLDAQFNKNVEIDGYLVVDGDLTIHGLFMACYLCPLYC